MDDEPIPGWKPIFKEEREQIRKAQQSGDFSAYLGCSFRWLATVDMLEVEIKQLKKRLGEDDVTGIICKAWKSCPHPEICQEKCVDKDLVDSERS